jgi:hypothetical protein
MSNRLTLSIGLLALGVAPISAQDTLPASTNPAERIVYRGDMAVEEQQAAQLMCYQWSSEQTSWDPEAAYAELEATHGDALSQYNSTRGAAVGGAARGAVAGLAIGAIAGDAGTGAAIGATAGGLAAGGRGRRGRASAQEQFQAAANDFRSNFQSWDRHWRACMIGNGYGVGE